MIRKLFKISSYVIDVFLGKVKYLFTWPYYRMRSSWFVWNYLLNKEGRLLHKLDSPSLSDVQRRIVKDLKSNGFSVTHIDEIFPNINLWNELDLHVKKIISEGDIEVKKGKSFLIELWEAVPVLNLAHPFVRLGLNEDVLRIVSGYLGMWSKLSLLSLHMTIPTTNEDNPVKSQRWHRDPEDKIMCKMFLYLNDVDENSGPFMYVEGSHYGGKWRNLAPQRPPKGYYPPLGLVERRVPLKDIKTFTGRAGTIIFCDTSGLHKGGHAKSGKRIMFTAGYNSKASNKPVIYRYGREFENELEELSPIIKYAVKDNKFQEI